MLFIGETLRIGGRNWSEHWNQLLGNILSYNMPTKDLPDTIISRTARDHASNRLLLLGPMADSTKYSSVPNIDLSGEIMLKMNLRKDRSKDDKLKIWKLRDFELHQVRSIVESLPSSLLNKGDTKPIILETYWSRIATGSIYDFVEGTLVQICHTHLLDSIGAYLEATHEGNLQYGVINNEGKVSVLEGTDIFMPGIKCRMLIPQDNFMDMQIIKNPERSFTMNWNKSVLKLSY